MARKREDIDPAHLAALNAGEVESRTLTEGLAVDFAALFRAVLPDADPVLAERMQAAASQGITRRMALAGDLAWQAEGEAGFARLAAHRSDTVRGWACYMISALVPDLAGQLAAVRPLADDGHFGVREWAWLALRPAIVAEPEAAMGLLQPWTGEASENLRRFASEATRPRGVWCAHIRALRDNPAAGFALLSALKNDPSRYVQDSVANWLNDASKDCPAVVEALCEAWETESPTPATARICKRALRTVRKARS